MKSAFIKKNNQARREEHFLIKRFFKKFSGPYLKYGSGNPIARKTYKEKGNSKT